MFSPAVELQFYSRQAQQTASPPVVSVTDGAIGLLRDFDHRRLFHLIGALVLVFFAPGGRDRRVCVVPLFQRLGVLPKVV